MNTENRAVWTRLTALAPFMKVETLSIGGLRTIAVAAAAAAGLMAGAAPASADIVSVQLDSRTLNGGFQGAYISVRATTSTPVTIEVNGVTLGGSPFALRPTNGPNGANYIVTVELNLAAGDQHIVASQKAADGTTSQQSTDVRSNGTTGSSAFTPNPIQTILNGFQTGSTGGHTVTFGMN
ncbi:hypothetical protein ACFROC_02865 [Nocardia tengchongensis]|uniref:hypothetical protein n=1 Tax=Nocardia tengchongensis TaxID=2055889 RepID=UPI003686BA86